MNPQRWRVLAVIAAINLGVFALAYLASPADKRHGLMVVGLVSLPFGLIGVALILALWRRFPVADDQDRKS